MSVRYVQTCLALGVLSASLVTIVSAAAAPAAAAPLDEKDKNIAALIQELENIDRVPYSHPGSVRWLDNERVMALVKQGDAAVEPLLEVLENDERLTRASYIPRTAQSRAETILLPVADAAHAALEAILQRRYFPDFNETDPQKRRRELAGRIRADWKKLQVSSPTERLYQTLLNDEVGANRWAEAARSLVHRGLNPWVILEDSHEPMMGEPLRSKQDPSVNELLEKRIEQLNDKAAREMANRPHQALTSWRQANDMARSYGRWDAESAAPLLERQTQLLTSQRLGSYDTRHTEFYNHLEFFKLRMRSQTGPDAAVRDYAAFLKSQPFGALPLRHYEPLWKFAERPEFQEVADLYFTAPDALVTALRTSHDSFGSNSLEHAFASPLMHLESFRSLAMRGLNDLRPIATLRTESKGNAIIAINGASPRFFVGASRNPAPESLRVADMVGFLLLQRETKDEHPPHGLTRHALDVRQPRSERDAVLEQLREQVASYPSNQSLLTDAIFGSN